MQDIHQQTINMTHYGLNERPHGFCECDADHFAALSSFSECSIYGIGSYRELINPDAEFSKQIWVDWRLFFYNYPGSSLRGIAIGIGKENGSLSSEPSKPKMYYGYFGCHHEWRQPTDNELKERNIRVYMFDNYRICKQCGTITNFDSSG